MTIIYISSTGLTNVSFNAPPSITVLPVEVSPGRYEGDFPPGTPAGQYPIIVYEGTEITGSAEYFWDGSQEISIQDLSALLKLLNTNQTAFTGDALANSPATGLSNTQAAQLKRAVDLLEADESIRESSYQKLLKGTSTPILSKAVTRNGGNIDVVESA